MVFRLCIIDFLEGTLQVCRAACARLHGINEESNWEKPSMICTYVYDFYMYFV